MALAVERAAARRLREARRALLISPSSPHYSAISAAAAAIQQMALLMPRSMLAPLLLLLSGCAMVQRAAAAPVVGSVGGSSGDSESREGLRRVESLSIEFGGRTREAMLYVPPSTPTGAALPLVFNYHGYGSDALQQVVYSFSNPLADEEGFA
eukprot:SAG31_NODE_21300_length_553_cov_0.678414_1_plen_152_part_10